MMSTMRLSVCVAFAALTGTAAADILHVPGDFPTIQAAIDAAMDGDEVEVHPGTYRELINFLGKSITVRSSDGPEVTIINGDIDNDGDGDGTVVTCDSAEGPDSVLEGFTITGGNAVNGGGMYNEESSASVTDCTFSGNSANFGGGMYNEDNSSPTLIDCTFSENTAINGGGMYNNSKSNPMLTNCTFASNLASNDGGGMYNSFNCTPTLTSCAFTGNMAESAGGGMRNDASSPVLTECIFSGNWAFSAGGGMYNDASNPGLNECVLTGNAAHLSGGGMYNRNSSPALTNCQFTNNNAVDDSGGGMFNAINSNPTLTNCTFSGNGSILGSGGGMFNSLSSPTLTDCIFTGNWTDNNGGAMRSGDGNPLVTNCTFANNTAGSNGGGISGSSATVANSILWGNSPDQINGSPTVTYTDVEGGYEGDGNIDADPLFVDPEKDDYHLSPGSPCIDAGNNWGVPIDENDYDEDGVLCELFPVDLDGNPRFNADEADFDPGCGVPVVVDMGAYEYQFDPADQVTFADLNGDDVVGAADLLGLLVSWGPCAKGCCLADLDIDGTVGASDLLALLVNWGPCP
ncbi:MAG: right-handed parallel beta-helix repeat-containing protein [Phycisphaerales bacterium]